MPPCQRISLVYVSTVRIHPSVKLHTTAMALIYKELHRVKVLIIRLFSLFTRKIAAPRLNITLIKGVAFWPYLKQQRVKAKLLKKVKLPAQRVTHLLTCKACKIILPYGMHPHPTELTLRGIGVRPCRVSNQPKLLSAYAQRCK